MNTALIFAGGSGTRMNSKTRPKQFLELNGKAIIIHTLEYFERCSDIDNIALANPYALAQGSVIYRNENHKLVVSVIQLQLLLNTILDNAENRHEVEFLMNNIKEATLLSAQDRLRELRDEYPYDIEFE